MVREVAPAGRPHRRRPAQPGRAARGRGHRHLPARAVARPARPLPQGRRPPVRVRGPRVRRPRRAPLQLRAVGGAGRAPARPRRRVGGDPARSLPTSRCCSPAASTTRGPRPWSRPWRRRSRPAGAQVGVLMGTAYLFTEEAVAAGAIQPAFQEAALDCERTVAARDLARPRHPLRRVAVRRGLRAAAAAPRRRRACPARSAGPAREAQPRPPAHRHQGPRRRDDDLVEVDDEHQRAEGMFMIGQVAALRDQPTTVADLHRQVTAGAMDHLATVAGRRAAPVRAAPPSPQPLDIAIVGMACIFPGAPDVDEFWTQHRRGVNAITEVPPERWDADRYYDPGDDAPAPARRTPVEVGRLPARRRRSTPLAYGIPPRSLAGDRAGAAAGPRGRGPRPGRRRLRRPRPSTGARVGGLRRRGRHRPLGGLRPAGRPAARYLGELPPELDEYLPPLTEDSFPGVLTNVIAGRIANRLDLGGVQLHRRRRLRRRRSPRSTLACKELRRRHQRHGAVRRRRPAQRHQRLPALRRVHALSPDRPVPHVRRRRRRHRPRRGRGRASCSSASPTPSATATASTPSSRAWPARPTAATSASPRPARRASSGPCDRAYERAGVSPAEVGLVEAHGTGTVVGDRTELATLTEVFAERRRRARRVRARLGEVEDRPHQVRRRAGRADQGGPGRLPRRAAADAATSSQPNPAYDADDEPVRVPRRGPARGVDERRVAGVSAFGFGGTNFHAVARALRRRRRAGPRRSTSGRPSCSCFRGDRRTPSPADRRPPSRRPHRRRRRHRLRDLARTAADAAAAGRCRSPSSPVASPTSRDQLDARRARRGRARAGARSPTAGRRRARREVAFLFPGQGSQRPGMLADLFVAFPELRRRLPAPATCWPTRAARRPPSAREARAAQRRRHHRHPRGPARRWAWPAWPSPTCSQPVGVRPDLVAGHSYGELVALAAAGALDAADAARAQPGPRPRPSSPRAGDDPGTMAAVAAGAGDVEAVLDGVDTPSWSPTTTRPTQIVISGADRRPSRAAVERLEATGVLGHDASPSPAPSTARWSPAPAPASPSTWPTLDVAIAAVPVWSNTTAAPLPRRRRRVRDGPSPSRSRGRCASSSRSRPCTPPAPASSSRRARAGCSPAGRQDPGRPAARRRRLRRHRRARRAPAAAGPGPAGRAAASTSTSTRCSRAGPRCSTSPGSRRRRRRGRVDGHLVRTADGRARAPAASSPRPSDPDTSRRRRRRSAATASTTARRTVLRYLAAIREVVAAERDVMLRYLGAEPGAPRPAGRLRHLRRRRRRTDRRGGPTQPPRRSTSRPRRLTDVVLRLVADRTGYPPDMLDPDLDLEADLSIDSIKRIEIIGELAEHIGLDTRHRPPSTTRPSRSWPAQDPPRHRHLAHSIASATWWRRAPSAAPSAASAGRGRPLAPRR